MKLSRHLNLLTVISDENIIIPREDPAGASSRVKPVEEWDGPLMLVLRELASPSWGNFTFNMSLPPKPNSYVVAFDQLTEQQHVPGWSRSVDVFWGGTYVTESRVRRASHVAPFKDAPLALVTPYRPPGFLTRFYLWTKPMSLGVWIACLITAMCVGVAFVVVDPQAEYFLWRGMAAQDVRENIVTSVYIAIMSFAGQGERAVGGTRGKMLHVGYTLFCLLMGAVFTGNLVAYLGHVPESGGPRTFEDFAVDAGGSKPRACVLADTAYAKFLATHPTWRAIDQVPCKSSAEIAAQLDLALQSAGEQGCDGTILSLVNAEWLVNGGLPAVCDLGTRLDISDRLNEGPRIMSMFAAMDQDVVDKLSYWVTKYRAIGRVDEVYKFFNQAGECDDSAAEADEALTMDHMGGVFAIFLMPAVVVLLWFAVDEVALALMTRRHGTLAASLGRFYATHAEALGLAHLTVKHAAGPRGMSRQNSKSSLTSVLMHLARIRGKKGHARAAAATPPQSTIDMAVNSVVPEKKKDDTAQLDAALAAHEVISTALVEAWRSSPALQGELNVPVFVYLRRHPELSDTLDQGASDWDRHSKVLRRLAEVEVRLLRGSHRGAKKDAAAHVTRTQVVLAEQEEMLTAVLAHWWRHEAQRLWAEQRTAHLPGNRFCRRCGCAPKTHTGGATNQQ